MPISKKYTAAEVTRAAYDYNKKTKRRVYFEYLLIKGKNDSLEHAKALAKLISGFDTCVNIIPANEIENGIYKQSQNYLKFRDDLMKLGQMATIRRTLGADIDAACGQLAEREEERKVED
jgi:23S rRNA (adenine2503-C2)-methyltransferase